MGGMTLGHFSRDHHETLHARAAGLCFVATSATTMAGAFAKASLKSWYGMAGRGLLRGLQHPSPRYPWPDNDLSALLLRTAFGPKATAPMIEAVREMSAAMSTVSMLEA